MFSLLNTAINQFAKRQMTWFRKMERSGISIFWLDGAAPLEENMEKIRKKIFFIQH
jgi:tRNA dimethylallyltransferase